MFMVDCNNVVIQQLDDDMKPTKLATCQGGVLIRRPAGVSDGKVLFLACTCSFVLFPRVFASSESKSPPLVFIST